MYLKCIEKVIFEIFSIEMSHEKNRQKNLEKMEKFTKTTFIKSIYIFDVIQREKNRRYLKFNQTDIETTNRFDAILNHFKSF